MAIISQSHSEFQPRIVLVRHGKPNVDEKVDRTKWNLSSSGLETVKLLGEMLKSKGFNFEQIISSPETKAVQTAKAISSVLGKGLVVIDENFSEHSRKQSEFLSQEDFDVGISQLFTEDPTKLVFGEETAGEAADRLKSGIKRHVQAADKDLIAVTHGTILSLFIS